MTQNKEHGNSRDRLLIFIVAYNAEKHLIDVLDRIPRSIFTNFDCEILVIDDHSSDNTFEVARDYRRENPELRITALFNPVNQGYGGNQKLGYRYAILNDFDYVVLLHGDGQYAPEYLEEMIEPLRGGKSHAVFGSRMIEKKNALKGGMPLYKFFGNIILTRIQNFILRAKLSEFHSGYRAYSVNALRKLPFDRNSNDFHFDTQIIIQILIARMKIVEIPIPTFYGNEICHVNGVKYAWNVLLASVQSKLHKLNIFYKLEYDIDTGESPYNLKLGYTSSHTMALERVRPNSSVLDLGAGPGLMARELKKRGCEVTGLDMYDQEENINFFRYIKGNLSAPDFELEVGDFDVILLLDIIEHVENPELLMDFLRKKIHPSKRPLVILTTPNIAFFIMRLQLLFGNFNYGKKGILDRTHKRLFTFGTLRKLCGQTGYKIRKIKGIPAPFPEAIGYNWISRGFLTLNKLLIRISKRLFSYQIYAELEPTPVVENMLQYSIDHSREKVEKMEG
jgi:glycosyltransferase involved in cell wall biosynthesis